MTAQPPDQRNRHAVTYAAAKALLASRDAADRERGRSMLESCAGHGHRPAQYRLAVLLLADRAAAARGLELLRAAADGGLAKAQHRLGLAFARGQHGLVPDQTEAIGWCRRAAEAGWGPAQFDLALLLAEAGDEASAHWLRSAAANGVEEAETCLAVISDAAEAIKRPVAWDGADTRLSVVLQRSGPHNRKAMRLAEYYCDPCLDLLANRYRIARQEAEDIVQQFFCELEEPLAKGGHAGRPWKEALRDGWDPTKGSFRSYLRRVLLNFARDQMRAATPAAGQIDASALDIGEAVADQVEAWKPALRAFVLTHRQRPTPEPRAATVTARTLEGASQDELARDLQVTGRTIRNDLRLGGDLLAAWLRQRLEHPVSGSPPGAVARLRVGLSLLPSWLSHPSQEKRYKALLLIALASAIGYPAT